MAIKGEKLSAETRAAIGKGRVNLVARRKQELDALKHERQLANKMVEVLLKRNEELEALLAKATEVVSDKLKPVTQDEINRAVADANLLKTINAMRGVL
jgi:hypothetical protein